METDPRADEIWRDIPDFPGYRASDQGRIGSCLVRKGRKPSGKWAASNKIARILKPHYRKGYAQISLCKNGRRPTVRIATLVMLAFHGPRPPGLEICHGNNVRDDDRLCNLRYDTHSANMKESLLNKEAIEKLAQRRRKLAPGQAKAARIEYAEGNISQRALGQRYGISQTQAGRLLRGITYIDAGGPILGEIR